MQQKAIKNIYHCSCQIQHKVIPKEGNITQWLSTIKSQTAGVKSLALLIDNAILLYGSVF